MFLTYYIYIFNILKCTKIDCNNVLIESSYFTNDEITLINSLNKKKKSYKRGKKVFSNFVIDSQSPKKIINPLVKKTSKCLTNANYKPIKFNPDELNFSKIFHISDFFYQKLLEHPDFIMTCKKIRFNIKKDFPSKELFRSFIIKFIIHKDFKFKKNKINYFIRSIAWHAHQHIVRWSQIYYITFMFSKQSIVMSKIIDSISISIDKNCYWNVSKLFDEDKLDELNKELDKKQEVDICSIFVKKLNLTYYTVLSNPNTSLIIPPINGLLN